MSRHPLSILAMTCLLTWSVLAGIASAAKNPANPLITDRGMFRPLIIVSPSLDNEAYRRMREHLQQHRDAFAERKMVLYAIEGGNGHRAGRPMTEHETRAVLEAMEVDPRGPLTVILVGMDGGKKMQLEGYVDPQQVFEIVDNMPIRPSEPRDERDRGTRDEGTP